MQPVNAIGSCNTFTKAWPLDSFLFLVWRGRPRPRSLKVLGFDSGAQLFRLCLRDARIWSFFAAAQVTG